MGDSFLIPLNKIPPEGLRFSITSDSKDWVKRLEQIVGGNSFNILLSLTPIEDSDSEFQVTGHIKTSLNLMCSRCALDFKYNIDKKISERICIQPEQNVQSSDVYFDVTNEELTVLNQDILNLSEFIYELIAIEEPIKPVGKDSCELDDSCENFIAMKKKLTVPLNERDESSESKKEKETYKPFSDLNKLF